MNLRVGNWNVEVRGEGSHPVWVTIRHSEGGGTADVIRSFTHFELRDLEYIIGRAIHAATEALPDSHKREMD